MQPQRRGRRTSVSPVDTQSPGGGGEVDGCAEPQRSNGLRRKAYRAFDRNPGG